MKYYEVEKDYSCAACGLRNCLIDLGIEVSEEYIRRLSNTTRNGCDEKKIIKAAKHFVEVKEYQGKSIEVLKRRISKCLKNGSTILICVDNELHWISILEYYKRKVKVVDSLYKDYNMSIVQWVTMKNIGQRANILNKKTNKTGYYFIELIKPHEE